MKKFVPIILIAVMCLSLAACSGAGTNESVKEIEPQASQMKSICELATMQCYYHNVAKYFEKDASGALWWKKDRKFWVEYSGVVTIGIDTSLVTMEIDGDIQGKRPARYSAGFRQSGLRKLKTKIQYRTLVKFFQYSCVVLKHNCL